MKNLAVKIKESKKLQILTIIVLGVLFLLITGLSFAYLAPITDPSKSTDIGGSADLVDDFKFVYNGSLRVDATPTTLPEGGDNYVTTKTATAKLRANSTNNTATYNYYLYLTITDNTFEYIKEDTPEVLLTITDPTGQAVTSLGNLTYTTYRGISGFDITKASGQFQLANNYYITSSSSTTYTEQEWKITITYFNQDFDQSANFGNSLVTDLSYKRYGIPKVNEVVLTSTGTSVTATINATPAANSISKYYYSLNDGAYIESTSNTYVFNNLEYGTNYKVSTKVLNSDGKESSVLSNTINTKKYVNPIITNVTSTSTSSQITVTITAQAGTSAVSKYYYSINDGDFVESTSNSYTFINLSEGTNYTIKTKVVDTLGKESTIRTDTIKTVAYVLPTITNFGVIKTENSITLVLDTADGDGQVVDYYYSIDAGTNYYKSDKNSYTFTDLSAGRYYAIKAYVVDSNGKSSVKHTKSVKTEGSSLAVVYVDATKTNDSITLSVTATPDTGNTITKYYYSIDGGSSYTESTSNSYTFTGLIAATTYNTKVYVKDSSEKSSNVYTKSVKTSAGLRFVTYIKSKYTGTQGENDLYYHNGTIKNGDTIIDANDNSYRFAGADPDNYVCFGSDASICPADNLYRIIGVIGDVAKLIKSDFATITELGTDGAHDSDSSYMWHTSNSNLLWRDSVLNTTNLNGNYIAYLNNQNSKWANMIVTATWKVGGNTYNNIANVTASNAYQNERTSPEGNITYRAKIGLMYPSDYGFAASPSAWTSTLYDYDSSSVTGVNWMQLGSSEWTITGIHLSMDEVFIVSRTGRVSKASAYSSGQLVRPVFSLMDGTSYISGTGTSSDPIRVSL